MNLTVNAEYELFNLEALDSTNNVILLLHIELDRNFQHNNNSIVTTLTASERDSVF